MKKYGYNPEEEPTEEGNFSRTMPSSASKKKLTSAKRGNSARPLKKSMKVSMSSPVFTDLPNGNIYQSLGIKRKNSNKPLTSVDLKLKNMQNHINRDKGIQKLRTSSMSKLSDEEEELIESGLKSLKNGGEIPEDEIFKLAQGDPFEPLKQIIKGQRIVQINKLVNSVKINPKQVQKQLYISEMKGLALAIENFKLKKSLKQILTKRGDLSPQTNGDSQRSSKQILAQTNSKNQEEELLQRIDGMMGELNELVSGLNSAQKERRE